MALALALTRTMLSLLYRADTAEDLGRAVRVAIRRAAYIIRNYCTSYARLSYEQNTMQVVDRLCKAFIFDHYRPHFDEFCERLNKT